MLPKKMKLDREGLSLHHEWGFLQGERWLIGDKRNNLQLPGGLFMISLQVSV